MRCWQKSRPEEGDYFLAREFKLHGSPFLCIGKEAVAARRLLCHLIEGLGAEGWRVRTAIDLSRKPTDKSVLLVEKENKVPSVEVDVACVALFGSNKLKLIDFPMDVTWKLSGIITRE